MLIKLSTTRSEEHLRHMTGSIKSKFNMRRYRCAQSTYLQFINTSLSDWFKSGWQVLPGLRHPGNESTHLVHISWRWTGHRWYPPPKKTPKTCDLSRSLISIDIHKQLYSAWISMTLLDMLSVWIRISLIELIEPYIFRQSVSATLYR